MKKRLVILSDLWGKGKAGYISHYTQILKPDFDIQFYDSCELGAVDASNYSEEDLHRQFVNGGIEMAAQKLVELERGPIGILAFSIGGTIAWKYGLKGGQIDFLICLSATRIRKEEQSPPGEIALFFGENDPYRRNNEWFGRMAIPYRLLSKKGHLFYREEEIAENLSQAFLSHGPSFIQQLPK